MTPSIYSCVLNPTPFGGVFYGYLLAVQWQQPQSGLQPSVRQWVIIGRYFSIQAQHYDRP